MPTPDESPSRRQVVIANARLHHVLSCFAGLWFPDAGPLGQLRGTVEAGGYLHDDGSGNRLHLAWSAAGVVGLVFDHESVRASEGAEGDRLAHLPRLPASLAALAASAAEDMFDGVTAGFWDDGAQLVTSEPPGEHGLAPLETFLQSDELALFGGPSRQSWLELASLDEAQGRLALRLARAAAAGPVKVSAADQAILLTAPVDVDDTVDVDDARQVKKALAEANVLWRVPVALLRRVRDEAEARARARMEAAVPAEVRALFQAAREGDVDTITRLTAAGVDIDVRTIEGQLEHTPVGDTPLIQACKAKREAAALALLAAGADPSARNRFQQTALIWAARVHLAEVVRGCLGRGAAVDAAEHDGATALHHAAAAGNAAIVEILLAAGADRSLQRASGSTPAVMARKRGHLAIAERLEG